MSQLSETSPHKVELLHHWICVWFEKHAMYSTMVAWGGFVIGIMLILYNQQINCTTLGGIQVFDNTYCT